MTAWMDEWAKPSLALEGDPVGLQIGRPDKPVSRVLAALEVTPEVAEEAVEEKADLIVCHHAVLYRPAKRLREDEPEGRILAALIRAGIAVYNAHTNLDTVPGGVNDVLAERLGLQDVEVLAPTSEERMFKLAVFVPASHHRRVLDAVCEAGGGWIGNYSHCTFNIPGKGTFLPREGAQPFVGRVGALEEVEEIRLETVVPEDRLEAVIAAMLAAHPYEEVAYDVYPLKRPVRVQGIGRIGVLPEPVALEPFARRVREVLKAPGVRFCGDPERKVARVAVLGGSGMGWARDARIRGADVLVTGDVKHHDALDALASGLALVDAGHYATEKWVVPAVARYLSRRAAESGNPLEVLVSRRAGDPFRFIS